MDESFGFIFVTGVNAAELPVRLQIDPRVDPLAWLVCRFCGMGGSEEIVQRGEEARRRSPARDAPVILLAVAFVGCLRVIGLAAAASQLRKGFRERSIIDVRCGRYRQGTGV